MAQPTKKTGTLRDKNDKSYVESPSRGPIYTAQEVFVGNGYKDPVPVDPTSRGKLEAFYGKADSVLPGVETLINSYTVPGAKGFDLNKISCSGDNIAKYVVKINNNTKEVKRSWWGDFNPCFDLMGFELVAGDKVEIFATNCGKTSETFEATIKGNEYDD